MNKQEQVEKLASLMADCNTTCDKCFEKLESVMTLPIPKRENYCQVYAYAQRAVEQGYRKLPEDSVVLTREECDNKVILDEDHFLRVLDNERAQSRKDTAKAILNVLYFNLQNSVKGHIARSNVYYNVMNRIQEIAKNYGVEIEE